MTQNEIYNLLMSGASLTRNWMQERENFGAFAKPRWKEWGGDERNKQLVIDYLKWR